MTRWFPVAFLTNGIFIQFRSILDFERMRKQKKGSEFFEGIGVDEVVSRCLPHQWYFHTIP